MTTKTKRRKARRPAERRCANPKCGKVLTGRANALYCNSKCGSQAAYARKQAEPGEAPKADLCFGCAHPTQGQAEPVAIRGTEIKRHPFAGDRPENSGWCVDPECPCRHCRPENDGGATEPKREEPKEKPRKRDIVGKCPIPKLRNPMLIGLHKRAVREGREACTCVKGRIG